MSDLLGLLKQGLGKEQLSVISQQIGADEGTTKKAISAAMPALIGGLGRQASSNEGASVLSEMLGSDSSGGILGSLMGMLGGKSVPESDEGVLDKVLGDRQQRVQQSISKSSGLDMASVKKLIAILGPLLLSVLNQKKKDEKLDDTELAGFLKKERDSVEESSGGLVSKLLDQDGDGDLDLDDVAKVAMGQLFG